MRAKTVKQSSLSAECWLVQIWGKAYCKKCDLRGTEDCGGKQIRKTGRNSKGIRVPVPSKGDQ